MGGVIFFTFVISIMVKAILEISIRAPKFPWITFWELLEISVTAMPFIPNVSHHGNKVKVINWCVAINFLCFFYLKSVVKFH